MNEKGIRDLSILGEASIDIYRYIYTYIMSAYLCCKLRNTFC